MKFFFATMAFMGLAFAIASQSDTAGASVVALDIDKLTDGSTLVVRANVTDVDVAWSADGHMINSSFELTIAETLKGSHAGKPVVRVPGGTLNGIVIRNGEAPEFALGEQVVCFLRPNADGTFRCFGWFQGKYTLLAGLEVREMNDVNWDQFRQDILAAKNN